MCKKSVYSVKFDFLIINKMLKNSAIFQKNNDWNNFVNGKYSRISENLQNIILEFFEKHSANYIYMKSYLKPNKYFEDYSKCLGVEPEMLALVGELCGKPDLEKETLIMKEAEKEIIN